MLRGQFTKVARRCEQCSKPFLTYPSAIKYHGARYCSRACYHQSRHVPLIDRFFHYLGRKTPAGCILWDGNTNRDGYGVIGSGTRKGRMLLAHRVAYELLVGLIPAGLLVLHRCDNPPCINPVHLFLGTQAVNIADMVAKGRGRKCVPGSRRYLHDLRRQG